MNNNMVIGINTEGLKKLGYDLLEYSEEFQKIKNELDEIERRLRYNFVGDGPDLFNDSVKSFADNLTYISKNIKNYHELCQDIIKSYDKQDIASFDK